jgi:DNA polymerase-3 subunit alpha
LTHKKSLFVHLHLHSQYSLLDGAIKFDTLAAKAAALGMSSVALTDHGSMFGAIEFFKKCVKAGVKPIIGCEMYVAPKSRFDKTSGGPDSGEERAYHLVLLAQDKKGYHNLCRLISAGFREGLYYGKPRVDRELLAAHGGGLTALSACLQGEVSRAILSERPERAEEAAGFYAQAFPGRFYLEIQDHGMRAQKTVIKGMIPLAKKMGLPLIATNDAHYLNREDHEAHDALICIGKGAFLSQENRIRYEGDQFYVKSAEEMAALFGDIPEALSNTLKVADECNFSFEFTSDTNKYHLPAFTPPGDATIDSHLEGVALHGLEARFNEARARGKDFSPETRLRYQARLAEEVAMIRMMGFSGYFLITADFIEFARSKGIPVGPGRGSAAGSMVAYALRITDLDPIRYGLIFERFLNPERISMPDIDVDFCMDRRGEVIDYVRKKYGGETHVAQIITFGAMKAKAVVRDVARVMEIPYAVADKIAKLIPNDLKMTIGRALEEEPRLKAMEKEDPKIKRLLDISKALEGTVRHASTHAAGVVISPGPLEDYMPLYKPSNSGEIVTQFQMKDVEELGLLKMDFLGLRTLTVINNTVNMVRKRKNPAFTIESIPLNDKKTFDLLCSAKTQGVFQLESTGMRDLIRKMKPNEFNDIIALVALFRPGPIQSGMADQYVRRKHGHEKVDYEFPELEPILGETFGVFVYQEQVMKMANLLAGFSLGQADSLRKAMGKKDMDKMGMERGRFVEGSVRLGRDRKKIEALWDQVEKFAEYGFNKSHSACYALVAYQTAFLKAHHPAEYMAALFTSEMGDSDKVFGYIQECKEMGIAVLPPDINESMAGFTVAGKAIRFGLAAVKGIGVMAAESIISAREKHGPAPSLETLLERVEGTALNKRAIEALVKCGAFDYTGRPRAAIFASIEESSATAQKLQRDKEIGQGNLFFAEAILPSAIPARPAEEPEWPEKRKLAFEKETLGFYISGHPLREFEKDLKRLANFDAATIADAADKAEVQMGGLALNKKVRTTKNGDRMANFTLEDLHGALDVTVWPDLYQKCAELLEGDEPIFVKGMVESDEESRPRLIAREIMTIPEARTKFTNSVHIHLSTTGLERETLLDLKRVFKSHPGQSHVVFHFRFHGKGELVLRAREERVAAGDPLIVAVEEIAGERSVYLE